MDRGNAVAGKSGFDQCALLLRIEAGSFQRGQDTAADRDRVRITQSKRDMLGQREFLSPGSAAGASACQNLVAGLLVRREKLAHGFMVLDRGADILEPHFAHMRGKACANYIAEVIDCFRCLQLPQAEQRGPRRNAVCRRTMAAFLLAGGSGDLFERAEKLSGPLMPLTLQRIVADLHLGTARGIEGRTLRLLADQTMFAGMFLDLLRAP